MSLTHLSLSNVRCFPSLELDLPRQLVVTGPNGYGKSTILEAISLLSLTRSHRARSDREVIRSPISGPAVVTGTVGPRQLLRLVLADQGGSLVKQAHRAGRAVSLSEFVGTVRTVLFTPEELELFTGPPRRRRGVLDGLLLQREGAVYAELLLTFHRSLRQRNALLNQRLTPTALRLAVAVWDELLGQTAEGIVARRETLSRELATATRERLEAMAVPLVPAFRYQTSVAPDRFLDALSARLERDQALGSTSVGPHRDDLVVSVNGRPVTSASRGEQRSLLVAVKLAEADRLTAADPANPPLMLVDDVMSELDPDRRALVAAELLHRPCLVTSADPASLPDALRTLPRHEL
jgi:DNA replication and repair protein RecF